jgi:hypothetical protein
MDLICMMCSGRTQTPKARSYLYDSIYTARRKGKNKTKQKKTVALERRPVFAGARAIGEA